MKIDWYPAHWGGVRVWFDDTMNSGLYISREVEGYNVRRNMSAGPIHTDPILAAGFTTLKAAKTAALLFLE